MPSGFTDLNEVPRTVAETLEGKTLFITGATGFLGQPLVEKCVQWDDHQAHLSPLSTLQVPGSRAKVRTRPTADLSAERYHHSSPSSSGFGICFLALDFGFFAKTICNASFRPEPGTWNLPTPVAILPKPFSI